jgi:hypothetical protein
VDLAHGNLVQAMQRWSNEMAHSQEAQSQEAHSQEGALVACAPPPPSLRAPAAH